MKTLTYPRAGAIHPLLIGVRFLVKSEPTILCQMSITMAFVASKGDSFVIQPLNALCLPLGESEMLSYPFPDIYGNQNSGHRHLPGVCEGHVCINVCSQSIPDVFEGVKVPKFPGKSW